MTITRRAALALAAAIPAARAQAQAFPSRPIRLLVPFPAGGTTDVIARLIAPSMTQTLGQPVVIENRGGAGGAIGAELVARAPADGHTLLMHNITFPTTTATLVLANRATHDIIADFIPVSLAANVPFVLLAAAAVPAEDLRGFITAARAATTAGSSYFYGSTGPGSFMNLVGELLRREANLSLEHIPFRGAAPLVQDMLAGRVQLGGDQLSTSLENIRTGALRGLATLSARRIPALPNLPTVREQGIPSLELEGWNGVFAPARTPAPVVARLQEAVAIAIRDPQVTQRLVAMGAEPVGSDAPMFAAMVTEQYAKIGALVGDVRLRIE